MKTDSLIEKGDKDILKATHDAQLQRKHKDDGALKRRIPNNYRGSLKEFVDAVSAKLA